MPRRKRSLPEIPNSSKQSNKRENDTPLPDSDKRRKHADVNNKELQKDSYCWICHQFGHDVECKKEKCQRVYHTVCLDKQFKFIDGVCPECQQLKSKNKFLTVDNLRDILKVAVEEFRKKFKSPNKMMFFQWPNIESRELVRIIDLDFLENCIKDTQNPYKSLADFFSDVKWIHHNYCILEGVDSSTAKEAEGFVRTFQKEIFDIEDCPMCYYNMLVPNEGKRGNFFLKICDPPHDIVWAKLKGSPHWPAKCLRVVNGKAHVRFFFTHDKSNIPLDKKKCLSISTIHPEHQSSRITDNNLIPNKMEYKKAVEELLEYIKLYEEKFSKKFNFHMVGTPYKYEAPKSILKREKKDSHNTLLLQNSEQNMQISPPPSVDHLNSSRDITENIEDNSANCPEIDANLLIDIAENIEDNSATCPEIDANLPIGSIRRSPKSALNPADDLSYIFNSSPELQTLFKDGQFVFDSMFVRCWAFANQSPQATEIIASIITQMKKLHADKIKLLQDNRALSQNQRLDEGRVYREEYASLQEINNKLRTQLHDMSIEIQEVQAENSSIIENFRYVLDGLHKQYLKTLDITVREAMKETDEALQEQNEEIRNLEQQISYLEQDVHELRCKYTDSVEKYNSKLEDMLKVQEEKNSQETIQEIKDLIVQHCNEIKYALKARNKFQWKS